MKPFIHPWLTLTLIQTKDGSFYWKYWNFRRGFLLIEDSMPKWEKKVIRQIKLTYKLEYFKQIIKKNII